MPGFCIFLSSASGGLGGPRTPRLKSRSLCSLHFLPILKKIPSIQNLNETTDIMLYISPWSRFQLTTSVMIGTYCIGSCKFNYLTITATMDPCYIEVSETLYKKKWLQDNEELKNHVQCIIQFLHVNIKH